MLPIIRTFISLPAGVARMPFWRFTVLTLARLHSLGAACSRSSASEAGDNWEDWKDSLHYVDYAVLAAIADRNRVAPDPTGAVAPEAALAKPP